jgi:hypothetical protein
MLCCGKCETKPTVGKISTPKCCYVWGEILNFDAEIDNPNSTEITSANVKFFQFQILHSGYIIQEFFYYNWCIGLYTNKVKAKSN